MSSRTLKQELIPRTVLRELRDARLKDAKALLDARRYAGSIYLGGYALECQLKEAICHRLNQDKLFGVFKTHDLNALKRYTGLANDLDSAGRPGESFRLIVALWNDRDGNVPVRYDESQGSAYGEEDANEFHAALTDEEKGVIPWLEKAIST